VFLCREIEFSMAAEAFERSADCSLFCSPNLLRELGYEVRHFAVFKNNKLLIVWPLIQSGKCSNKPPFFSYFFGPYWVTSDMHEAPYKLFKNNLDCLNIIFPIIEKVASKNSFSLVPEFPDLRPFLWWNYHNPEGPKFDISLRYTARIDLSRKLPSDQLVMLLRADDKRKKIRKALRERRLAIRWGVSLDPAAYIHAYCETLGQAGTSLDNEEKSALSRMISCVDRGSEKSGEFKLIELIDAENGVVEGFQLILRGKKLVYLIAQSVSTKAKKENGSVLLTFEAIRYANECGLILDFNGANSPNRADDKHAFGADIVSYHDIRLVHP
jgi:hypothetical protein